MFGFRPSPADHEILEEFEANAERASEVQERLLHDILEHNADAEYLQRHGLQGRTDVTSFKSTLPVIVHADIANDVQRIANGDRTPILSVDPVENFSLSSGTSAGKSKLIPVTRRCKIKSTNGGDISPAIRHRTFELKEGSTAVLALVFAAKRFETKGGLMAGTATSNYFHSDDFTSRNRTLEDLTSPDEVILQGVDFKQVMYCHLMCAILRRHHVGVIMSFFAYMVVEAFRMLENTWEELCVDIRNGTLNEQKVSDPVLRNTMARMLKPDMQLADDVEVLCRGRPWDGIVERLWPNAKFVLCVMTGAMAPYTKTLQQYAGNTPLVNSDYGASECFPIGINMNPVDPPEKVVFTMVPTAAYVEFARVKPDEESELQVVDMSNVEVGEMYEIILTTFSGLYRYRLGDVVKVEGFYKTLPRFAFVRRLNVVLSINTDKTDEMELQMVVGKASEILNLELADYTSYADLVSKPGHYVIFFELKCSHSVDDHVLHMCSSMMDSSFNSPYTRGRAAGTIGRLELCIVAEGTFSRLLEFAIKNGASASQFKTPRCITNPEMLSILRGSTTAKYFSPGSPDSAWKSWSSSS